MDYNAIALALETAAETTGINALDYVPDSLPSAAFYVGEMDIEMDVTFRRRPTPAEGSARVGTDQATITCRVLVARTTDKYAVRKMRNYMSGSGATSIAQAIGADRTLGGTVHASQVKRLRGNRQFDVGGRMFYGVEIDVFVIGDAT